MYSKALTSIQIIAQPKMTNSSSFMLFQTSGECKSSFQSDLLSNLSSGFRRLYRLYRPVVPKVGVSEGWVARLFPEIKKKKNVND